MFPMPGGFRPWATGLPPDLLSHVPCSVLGKPHNQHGETRSGTMSQLSWTRSHDLSVAIP